jgi:hypothetical protein
MAGTRRRPQRQWLYGRERAVEEMNIKVPASITFDAENLYIDGVKLSLMVIPQLLYELSHPSSRHWYRLERVGNQIIVHVRISDEPFESMPIAIIGK